MDDRLGRVVRAAMDDKLARVVRPAMVDRRVEGVRPVMDDKAVAEEDAEQIEGPMLRIHKGDRQTRSDHSYGLFCCIQNGV